MNAILLTNSAYFRLNWVSSALKLLPFQVGGAIRGCGLHLLAGCQLVQPFQVPSQTYQAPLTRSRSQTAQRELPESQHFLDDADHRLDRRLTQAVDGFANLSLKLVGHLDYQARIMRRWFGRLSKTLTPALVVWLTPRSDKGVNVPRFKVLDILGGKVDLVQRSCFGLTDLGRDGIDGGNRLVRVAGDCSKFGKGSG